MVMTLDVHADRLHLQNHFRAQILEVIARWNGEVAFLITGAVTQVWPVGSVSLSARIPLAFIGIDKVETMLLCLVKSDAVEDEELRLRAEKSLVGEARRYQIFLRAFRDVPRVPVVRFTRKGIGGISYHHQCRFGEERIHERRIGIGDQQHVRFVDRSPSPNRAGIEPKPILERTLFQFADRVAHVLPDARYVNKSKIENLRAVFLCKFKYAFWVHSRSLRN